MQDKLAKLELIRGIDLPANLFDQTSPRYLEHCRQRVSVEVPRDLRRHPDAARLLSMKPRSKQYKILGVSG
jgi:hypothetical protein